MKTTISGLGIIGIIAVPGTIPPLLRQPGTWPPLDQRSPNVHASNLGRYPAQVIQAAIQSGHFLTQGASFVSQDTRLQCRIVAPPKRTLDKLETSYVAGFGK